ncbi:MULTISPECIES: hypothetical protein [Methanoculleus]|jgi:hypothetical protein|uniref:Uncharacterized protein n=1 Tax=Methanoculleus thermophilus TaxID=2200 RepID=A0A1G8YXQ1_9EURY|nr:MULTISPECIES: hypothetical protein [Methanoculleus]SDK07527.1 hypothetical protein SAMN04488571_103257 [Methanoculleus thermophilus]HQD26695.1 hypothetical protein [Methanoculleus thermophilus]
MSGMNCRHAASSAMKYWRDLSLPVRHLFYPFLSARFVPGRIELFVVEPDIWRI